MYEERLQKFQTDYLLTMCSAHCVSSVFFFNRFWQNQFRSTIFNFFTSLMHFSLLGAVYSVVFAFLSPFLKNIQEVER